MENPRDSSTCFVGHLQESVDDETTGGAFPLRVAVKGVTVDISALSLSPWDMTLGSKLPFFSYGRDGHHTL